MDDQKLTLMIDKGIDFLNKIGVPGGIVIALLYMFHTFLKSITVSLTELGTKLDILIKITEGIPR